MARRYVQNEWPELFPSLITHLQNSQEPVIICCLFECVKKICKKYRFMFRSDELYTEMNYVIENFSSYLLNSLTQCTQMAQQPETQNNEHMVKTLFGIVNSILHIIESILSQEELPNFYEEQLPHIYQAMVFVLN